MTTTTPPARIAAPTRTIHPRPLWERHRLFQEPAWPDRLDLEDEDDRDEDE